MKLRILHLVMQPDRLTGAMIPADLGFFNLLESFAKQELRKTLLPISPGADIRALCRVDEDGTAVDVVSISGVL